MIVILEEQGRTGVCVCACVCVRACVGGGDVIVGDDDENNMKNV